MKIRSSGGEGEITLQFEKKSEMAGAITAYIYLVMDAQLNIENGAFISTVYHENADDDRTSHSTVFDSDMHWKTHLVLACLL